jgi:hydrogenase expression/formation protein HypC
MANREFEWSCELRNRGCQIVTTIFPVSVSFVWWDERAYNLSGGHQASRKAASNMCLAIPAKVIDVSDDDTGRALVEVIGVRRHIDTGLLQDNPPVVGDWVLVHVGFAMSKISEEQAQDQLRMLTMLGEHSAALEEVRGYDFAEAVFPEPSPPSSKDPIKVYQ